MAAKLTEIAAIFVREKWRSPDPESNFFIGEVRTVDKNTGHITPGTTLGIVGDAEPDDLKPQCEYNFYGTFEKTERYGWQFRFKSFMRSQPHTQAGIVRYLQECDGIGPVAAQTLWAKFGGDAVRILRESPDVAAAAVPRMTEAVAQAASEKLREMQTLEHCMIDLIGVLDGRGFPKSVPQQAVKAWGNRAAAVIKANPHILMRFKGVGFLKADAMYVDLGLPAGKMKRQALCAWHGLASDSDGHTWHPLEKAEKAIKAKIAGVEVDTNKAIMLAYRAGIISIRNDDAGKTWVAEYKKAEAENYIAKKVVEAEKEESHWPKIEAAPEGQPGVTPHQAEQLSLATAGPIGIFAGAPGTGKSYTLARLIAKVIEQHGASSIAVAAPTGKAACRITDIMAGYGVTIRATTIHSLLRVRSAEDGWSFDHGEGNPLPYQFIAVDELSMCDNSLFASLLAARGRGTNILLTGDANQLPPVGSGAPLRDLIDAKLPYGELREIHRNAGTVVRACSDIRDGKNHFPIDDDPDPTATPPRNLALIPCSNGAAVEKLIEVIRDIKDSKLFDPVWEVQVIVAVNDKSALSRRKLNKLLQDELNPTGKTCPNSPFRVNDKVIQLKNGFLRRHVNDFDSLDLDEDGDTKVFVANGEFGRVLEVEPKKTIVEFFNPKRVVMIPRGKQEGDDGESGPGCDLDLAFACTAHKLQGSSAKCVIVCLDEYSGATGKFGVCKREWLFTSISRTEVICFLLGKLSTAREICREPALYKRKTFLAPLIAHYRATRQPGAGGLRSIVVKMMADDAIYIPAGVGTDGGKPSPAFWIARRMGSGDQPGGYGIIATDNSRRTRRTYATIHANGDWTPDVYAPWEVTAAMEAIDADPWGVLLPAVKVVGRKTGVCCFCNRPLKTAESMAVGYGPDCARKYGMPWGESPAGGAADAADPAGEGESLPELAASAV